MKTIAQQILETASDIKASDTKFTFERDDRGFADVSFRIRGDALTSLLKLLRQCEYNGNVGHSFEIIADPDGGEDGRKKYGFDGDGSDKIEEIKVNGKPLPRKFSW